MNAECTCKLIEEKLGLKPLFRHGDLDAIQKPSFTFIVPTKPHKTKLIVWIKEEMLDWEDDAVVVAVYDEASVRLKEKEAV